ncbi:MAG: ACT domain-containing protein [Oscillospiraceae bacterium]|nr:ACT domain-containing protein [Oscillospiraceae bacterium]
MTVEQLSVFVENRPGKLLEALETLGDANVDLRALSLADTSDFGILRIIVDSPSNAFNTLGEAGFLVKSNDVLAVVIGDKPGGLAAIVRILSDAGVNIEYTYAFVAHSRDNAYVILRVDDNDEAIKVLSKNDVTLLSSKELYSM